MAFQLSPGVVVTEEDRTTVVPSVATTAGAFSGAFQWGPVEQVVTVDSEGKLVEQFGVPNDTTAGYFFTAANFLSYGNNLQVTRVVDKSIAQNAVSVPNGTVSAVTVTSSDRGFSDVNSITLTISAPTSPFGGTTATATPILYSTGNVFGTGITTAGFGYSVAPTLIVNGDGSGAILTALLGAGQIGAINLINSGNNYTTLSNVVIQNQGSTSASANLDVHFKLKDIEISTAGTNYGSANIVVSGGTLVPGGQHATVVPVVTANVVTGYTITSSGNGYLTAPTITVNRLDGNTGVDAVLTANLGYGYIDTITLLNPGAGGYAFAPNVTINRNNTLGGTDATANTRLEAEIIDVAITNAGFGYTEANVSVVPATQDLPYITSNALIALQLGFQVVGANVTNIGSGYIATPTITIVENTEAANAIVVVDYVSPLILNEDNYTSAYSAGGLNYGMFAARYPGTLGNSIKVSLADSSTYSNWAYASSFDSAPSTSASVQVQGGSNDEIHVIVIDVRGSFTGTPNSILEKYSFLSKASDAKTSDQASNYYKDVINDKSSYVWVLDHPSTAEGGTNWGQISRDKTFGSLLANVTTTLSQGVSGDTVGIANILAGYEIFSNDEEYDVGLIPMGPTTSYTAVNSVIAIAESRRDCVVFASPPYADVVNTTGQAAKIITHRDNLTSSSFAVLDSGWKYQYDRYNDKYRYVPLNGDIAGLSARTDYIADPWFSPAGYNRGVIKNVVKLSWSPSKADRDALYKKGVNPVVTFPGQGTLLFGDKTLLARPSAFDRINVRRLFIVLEKAIATASKFQLFEFNDAFTRAQFRNLVEPFLRDVQGRRGVTDFRVVCDETNNTGEVIDRNEFVADIYIKPARAINFIQLNFIATRTGVSFEEVGA